MSLHHDPPSRVLCLLHVTCHITVADVAGGGHAAVLFWLPGARPGLVESVAMTVLASPGLRTAAYLPTAEWRPRRLRLHHSAVPSVPADQGGIF